MTLNELIAIADQHYDDGLIGLYFSDPQGKHGDGLAAFIAIELRETFNPNTSTEDQLITAAGVIESATGQLEKLSEGLRDAAEGI